MALKNQDKPKPCIICGKTINIGEEISWSRRNPEKGSWHPACSRNASADISSMEYQTTTKWTSNCTVCGSSIAEGTVIIYNPVSKKARHAAPCTQPAPMMPPAPSWPTPPAPAVEPASYNPFIPAPAKPEIKFTSEFSSAEVAPAEPAPQIPMIPAPPASGDLGAVFAQLLNVPAQIQAAIGPAIASMRAAVPSEESINKMVAEALASAVPTKVVHVIEQPGKAAVEITGAVHKLFGLVLKTVTTRDHNGYMQNVALYGESGSGKTQVAEQIATALSLPYYYASLNPQTPESRMIGYMDANGNYIPSLLYKAYTEGGVYLFDEYDNASGALLNTLNSALANGRGSFPCGMVQQHKDFVAIAATNTPGFGASSIYTDRRAIDNAARQRFAWMEFNTDESLEMALAKANSATKGERWARYVQGVRKWAKKELPKLLVTMRASIKGAAMLEAGHDTEHVFNTILAMGFDKDSITKLLIAHPLPNF